MHDDVLIARARSVAQGAHATQVDKLGQPYTLHLAAVAERAGLLASRAGWGRSATAEAVATGWLHDLLEDTELRTADLHTAGFPNRVVHAVHMLTRRDGIATHLYYLGVRSTPLSLLVKQADLWHNTSRDRMAQLDEVTRRRLTHKYRKAHLALGLEVPAHLAAA